VPQEVGVPGELFLNELRRRGLDVRERSEP
jgi:hypothetical protein